MLGSGQFCFSTNRGDLIFAEELNARQLYQKYFALSSFAVDLIHADTYGLVAEYQLLGTLD